MNPPLMVLRGSKTAPDDSLQHAIHELHDAKARVAEANARLDRSLLTFTNPSLLACLLTPFPPHMFTMFTCHMFDGCVWC
jgi:hypothetical protein